MSLRAYFRLFTQIQLMPIMESGEEILVGGQAVMEGVMMRAPHSYCVAVRKPDGEIVTEETPLARMSEKHKIFKYPVFRGVGTLWQAMTLGLKALRFSSQRGARRTRDQAAAKQPPKEIPGWAIAANLVFTLGMFIFMYKFVPLLLVTKLQKLYPVLAGRVLFNVGRRRDPHGHLSGVPVRHLAAGRTSGACSSTTARSTKWSSISNRASR